MPIGQLEIDNYPATCFKIESKKSTYTGSVSVPVYQMKCAFWHTLITVYEKGNIPLSVYRDNQLKT